MVNKIVITAYEKKKRVQYLFDNISVSMEVMRNDYINFLEQNKEIVFISSNEIWYQGGHYPLEENLTLLSNGILFCTVNRVFPHYIDWSWLQNYDSNEEQITFLSFLKKNFDGRKNENDHLSYNIMISDNLIDVTINPQNVLDGIGGGAGPLAELILSLFSNADNLLTTWQMFGELHFLALVSDFVEKMEQLQKSDPEMFKWLDPFAKYFYENIKDEIISLPYQLTRDYFIFRGIKNIGIKLGKKKNNSENQPVALTEEQIIEIVEKYNKENNKQ